MSKKTVQRQSQLITTFGPGAMVDLPTRSVLIGGLDRWRLPFDGGEEIEEPALARLLEQWLRDHGRLDEGETVRLIAPPATEADGRNQTPGVDVTIFPTWFVCQRRETIRVGGSERYGRRLVHWHDLEPKGGRRCFVHDDGAKDEVTPIRFVGACPNGHLQDVDWRSLLHPGMRCREPMWLTDRGTSGLLADLEVVCACGTDPLSLQDATQPGRLGFCDGHTPWIASNAQEACQNDHGSPVQLRLLTRMATNAYFSQTISVISLPSDEDELGEIIEAHRVALSKASSPERIEIYREGNPALDNALQGYDNEAVFARLQQIQTRDSEQSSQSNPRLREFQVFGSGQPEIGENTDDSDLYAETLAPQVWESPLSPAADIVNSVVAVHRLREVMAIYGFTRLEPAPSVSEGDMEEIQLAVKGAPLGERHNWLPAIKQYGEGIFIRFNEALIDHWQGQDTSRERGKILYRGYKEHLRRSPSLTEDNFKFPGLGYILLHSLAHALITEIALECGYPVSSLKERIYAFRSEQEPSRYGILIYAVTLGADGTLGGLVQVASRLLMILERALERLEICSNDPVCADHDPASQVDDCTLVGAACHGCLLLPETSCERRNSFLDRSLLVDTMASQVSSMFAGKQR